ncbi:MAG TPA: ribosome maturation factor RimM [Polyangiaceae bacterium]|nr:ribosome maturation factor RimM [Polyangiaceae bacterium]
MLKDDAWVPLAAIARPHGVRGEVKLKLYNSDSDLLLDQDEVLLRFPDGEEQEVSVDGARRADDAILMKLHSVDDRDRADELRDAAVCIRRGSFPPLDEGEFYACDIEGAQVVVDDGGGAMTELGRVIALRSYPTTDVLEVTAADGGRPWEVPLIDSVVRSLDVGAGLVTLATLEGVERA